MPENGRKQGVRGSTLRRTNLPLARTVRVRRRAPQPATGAATTAAGDAAALHRAGLTERLEKLSFAIEKMNLAEYTSLLQQPWRLIWVNFVAGLARGLGTAVGFSVLGAVLLYLLRNVVMARLPDLADLAATIVKMVELNLRR